MDSWPCAVSYDFSSVLPRTDVVMMLRVQHERMSQAYFPTVREYSRRYGLDNDRMALLPDHAIVMHPGPMNRGVEIAAEVADSPRSTIVEQVANGVSVRMAVLYLLLGGSGSGPGAGPAASEPRLAEPAEAVAMSGAEKALADHRSPAARRKAR